MVNSELVNENWHGELCVDHSLFTIH